MQWILLMTLLLNLLASALFAKDFQEPDPIRAKLSLTCIQLQNHQVIVKAKLLAKPDKQYLVLANAAITFYNLTDSTEVILGKGITDKKGFAEIIVNAKDQLSIDEDGYYSIKGAYEGDENHKPSEDELLFKPAILEMEAEVLDSLKTITIKIYENSEEATPIGDAEVILQVPRMFSNLTIISDFTDEDGIVSFEFPNDLPGGKNGELLIMAKVEDTDEHASLQSQVQKDWGIPKSTTMEFHQTRTLWTPDAPMWMVITFSLLITIVWGHFLIIVYKLSLIRKEGKTFADKPT